MTLRRARVLAVLMGLVLAGCGTPGVPAPPSPVASSLGTPVPPIASVSVSAPAATRPDEVATPSSVRRDDSLLAILPPDIDGVPVVAEEASFAEAAADEAFALNVERAAFAIVTSPTDLASGVVAALRSGVFSDAFFLDWRETYDEGACGQAGGVTANAETDLDGRRVFIATCGGGLRVYHTHLEERDVIVSLFSLGEARYGERLIGDLRP